VDSFCKAGRTLAPQRACVARLSVVPNSLSSTGTMRAVELDVIFMRAAGLGSARTRQPFAFLRTVSRSRS